MIWAIIPGWLKRAVAWLAAAFGVIGGAWLMGKRDARRGSALEAAEAYAKTTKEIDNAPVFGDDDDYARRVMRERPADQP